MGGSAAAGQLEDASQGADYPEADNPATLAICAYKNTADMVLTGCSAAGNYNVKSHTRSFEFG